MNALDDRQVNDLFDPGPVSTEDSLRAVDRFLGSRSPSTRKSRMANLLEHVVREEVEGRGERLKAFAIAMDVFNRGAGFDPQNDSIVRVEMYRLRTALAEYYALAGRDDLVQIDIPKGKYRPQFSMRRTPAPLGERSQEKRGWVTSANAASADRPTRLAMNGGSQP